MNQISPVLRKEPTIVMPAVYELPLGFWRWCKISDVCKVIPQVASLVGISFTPTPEELVSRFAGLVRPNRIPTHSPEKQGEVKKKIFRYSKDGISFWGTEVPVENPAPPYIPFKLGIGYPYPQDMYVPEGWVIDTMNAVRMGAVAAADFGEGKIGFAPKIRPQNLDGLITLEGKGGMIIAKLPDCVQ